MPRFATAAAAEAHLLSFINYELKVGYRATTRSHDLGRFAAALAALGWDPSAVPTVHVGGTNGKGSVATLLARILQAGGLTTGLYTSPHLSSMRERVGVDGRPISAEAFRRGVEQVAGALEVQGASGFRTTFEHLTALAFMEFQRRGVDRAVLEVGLGGKLDATNVIPPGPVVLTPISLDHQHTLGSTVGRIAGDKAHIIKAGGRAFFMPQIPAVKRVLVRRAEKLGVPWVVTEDAVRVLPFDAGPDGQRFRIVGRRDYGAVRTRLLGRHQASNVAAAVAVAEQVLPAGRVAAAVARGLPRAAVPGRLDPRRGHNRRLLLDGGHNPAAGETVAAALRRHYPDHRVTAVIGMPRDKDHGGYLQALAQVVDRFIFTRAAYDRAADPGVLREALGFGGVAESLPAALGHAMSGPADLVLVAGSFVFLAEAMDVLGLR